MNGVPTLSQPPRRLALRLIVGCVLALLAVLALSQRAVDEWNPATLESVLFWKRCGSSLAVLVVALSFSVCLALGLELLTSGFGGLVRGLLSFCGRVLACAPVAALAWGFVGLWIGRYGGPVETLMPAELPAAESMWWTRAARVLWEFLAPALLLAIPLSGELVHGIIRDAPVTNALDLSLRARGIPRVAAVWRHRLPQLLPVAGKHLRSLCLIAPVYFIVVEDVLRFMGWGAWMAQSLRGTDVDAILSGMVGGVCMVTALLGVARIAVGRVGPAGGKMSGLAWQPWLLWAMACMAVMPDVVPPWLVLWFAVLLAGGADWHQAWLALEQRLPLEAARVVGGRSVSIWWRHAARVQARFLTAWITAAFARAVIWIVVACAVRPAWVDELSPHVARWVRPLAISTSLGAAAALADPLPVLEAGGVVALAALFLTEVSRIIQPRAT
ncbi:MAG: ABC transporter permease subunit [Prosthecobacter sp.]